MAPGEMGGYGQCFKLLDECYIDDIAYLWKQYERAANKVQDEVDKIKS